MKARELISSSSSSSYSSSEEGRVSRTRTSRRTRTIWGAARVLVMVWFFGAGFARAALDQLLTKEESAAADRILKGEPPARPEPAVLRWRNGETLTGEVLDATENELRWKSPLFEDPLVLNWTALRRIDRTLPPIAPVDPFSIALRNGSHLYGDLVAVSDESVSIRSTRHGAVELKRSEVLSVRRLRGGNLVTAGPAGDAEWRLQAPPKNSSSNRIRVLDAPSPPPTPVATMPQLKTGPGGALLLPYWNRRASLSLDVPEMLDLEFRVRSSGRPDFQLFIDAGEKQKLRIETWVEELVLTAGDGFKVIRKFDDSEREIALRICWDRKARKCSVFTPAGEPLAEWEVPEETGNGSGQLQLQNKGRDLALELLRVRVWDGQPPTKITATSPRIELSNGNRIEGKIGGPVPLAISSVDALIFSADLPQTNEADAVLTFADGTRIAGRIGSFREGVATLATPFAVAPLSVKTDGLSQILLGPPGDGPAPQPVLAELDSVVIDGTPLHGRLAAAGDGQPRWLPVGGVTPARIAARATSEITRGFPADARWAAAPVLIFTSGGDVLPANLRSLDRTGVELDAGVFKTPRLAPDQLEAIVFGAATASAVKGFADAGWRIIKGNEKTVTRKDDSLRMEPQTAISHGSLLQSREIEFTMTIEQGYGGVRLRLFDGGEEARAEPWNLIVANLGNRIYYGMENPAEMGSNYDSVSVPYNTPAVVRLIIEENAVQLVLNGVPMRRYPIPAEKRRSTSLVIGPGNVFGNGERAITLTKFSTKTVPGGISIPAVNAEARTQALTIPRFRQEDPPRQALLAANGDVLRGEIEAITATHIGFRAGLETLRVPRERVKAAIWLKQPAKDAPPPEPPSPVIEALKETLTRRIRYSGATLATLTGVLQREVPALKFKLPASDKRTMSMSFGTQTVGAALDEICAFFNVRYRVENGTIVIEAGPQAAKDLEEKVYWLKPDAFPAAGSVQEILTGKGVAFHGQAVARWLAQAGQLSMSNTAANHEKLIALIAAEFGGGLGSPSHWLSLTNGAHFGLAVDRFDADAITGHHPIYGPCRVPLADVHRIRSVAPETNPSMKALEGWRLVFAPEPVLPETGGESSPLTGKAAKAFKLPLLGGGEFDLAAEQGKVVVLDFWATWCGPCIKSLPALLEAMAALPADRVKLIGVNQSEPAEQVKRFLDARGWKLTVALDAGQNIGRQYGVEGIPHTVIVGPDGKIAWVKTGYSPDGAAEAANAVRQLLAAPGGPAPK